MMMQVDGKIALVTGGSSGIGEATARLLAKEGAVVGVLGRDPKEVERVVSKIEKANGKAMALVADVSKPAEIKKAVDQLAKAHGQIDLVLANAGINGKWAPLDDLTEADF